MASNAEALPIETGGATREASRPATNRHGALTWLAVTAAGISVAALAVVTLGGGEQDGDIKVTRYDARAQVLERRAHLEGQAWTIGRQAAAGSPNATPHGAAQLAERAEHRAHLEGQAWTIGPHPAASAPNAAAYRTAQLAERAEHRAHLEGQAGAIERQTATTANAPEPAYLPGSRHMPTR
jgi:hypothetical protein